MKSGKKHIYVIAITKVLHLPQKLLELSVFLNVQSKTMDYVIRNGIVMVTVRVTKRWRTFMKGQQLKKLKCVSHVQKRELKKKNKGLGRKGKLTKTIIDKLQNYFRIAIKSNKGVLEGMK